jgi:hypothetical protein
MKNNGAKTVSGGKDLHIIECKIPRLYPDEVEIVKIKQTREKHRRRIIKYVVNYITIEA